MQFRSEFFPSEFKHKIKHTDSLMLMGSCFTEQIGNRLLAHKFDVLQNPNGILFNPVSISHAIETYISNKIFNEDDLFFNNELYGSWLHHTQFSGLDKNEVLNEINNSQFKAHSFLKKANWLMLTLGSSFIYEKIGTEDNSYSNVVANCHKVPADKFNRRLLTSNAVAQILKDISDKLSKFNPGLKIIFTISPVRHLREGFVENNRSKAALIEAVHSITNEESIFYFPSYELVIDDLRDYRFYAEDLVHPNYAATKYIWEKFVPVCIDKASRDIIDEVNEINSACAHKPFKKNSKAHHSFLAKYLSKTIQLQNKFPYINFEKESQFVYKYLVSQWLRLNRLV